MYSIKFHFKADHRAPGLSQTVAWQSWERASWELDLSPEGLVGQVEKHKSQHMLALGVFNQFWQMGTQ